MHLVFWCSHGLDAALRRCCLKMASVVTGGEDVTSDKASGSLNL